MCDLEQWVHIVQVHLPQSEGLHWCGMERGQINGRPTQAEEEMIAVLVNSLPLLSGHNLFNEASLGNSLALG